MELAFTTELFFINILSRTINIIKIEHFNKIYTIKTEKKINKN